MVHKKYTGCTCTFDCYFMVRGGWAKKSLIYFVPQKIRRVPGRQRTHRSMTFLSTPLHTNTMCSLKKTHLRRDQKASPFREKNKNVHWHTSKQLNKFLRVDPIPGLNGYENRWKRWTCLKPTSHKSSQTIYLLESNHFS